MKTFVIKITRVFKESSKVIRDRLIRLESKDHKDLTLYQLMSKIGWKFVILSLSTHKKVTSRIRLIHKFSTYLLVMTRRHGAEFTVKYLKACNLALSKFVAGEPFKSLRDIEPDLPLPRLVNGLPAIIGTRDRRSLRNNNIGVFRLYATLFSLYRVISIPGKLKLNTITDPFTGSPLFLKMVENWLENNSLTALQAFKNKVDFVRTGKFVMSENSSPFSSKSWTGMVADLSLLQAYPLIFKSFLVVLERTCTQELVSFVKELAPLVPNALSQRFDNLPSKILFKKIRYQIGDSELLREGFGIGQLATKLEAAGKIRVFAMVDSWTQTACQSLHNYLMELLNAIPNDGSKDHGAAFERASRKAVEFNCCFGYDLSAATDRLPLSLQVKILSKLFDPIFASNWANLLVGRTYTLYSPKKKNQVESVDFLKYAVGQPMGAKSSWTMLALTHHMIMQFCAWELGFRNKWEERYEIVGDDIVIFDEALALKYLFVMKNIGVPINTSKSVVARKYPVCEFVKRISIKGKEITPFTWKQFISQDTMIGRINTTIGLFLKEKEHFGSRAISVFRTVLKDQIWDRRPIRDCLSLVALYTTYAFKSGMQLQYILRMLHLGCPRFENKVLIFDSFDYNRVASQVKDMILKGVPSVEIAYYRNMRLILEKVSIKFATQMANLKDKFTISDVNSSHNKITLAILGYIIPSDDKLVEIDRPINQIEQDMISLIKNYLQVIHDPAELYPWLALGWFHNVFWSLFDKPYGKRYVSFNMDFYKRIISLGWFNDVLLYCDTKLDKSEIVYRLFNHWQGKASLLSIVDRLTDKKVEEIKGVSDTAILSLLTSCLKDAMKDKEYEDTR